jgi:hypothetical protein
MNIPKAMATNPIQVLMPTAPVGGENRVTRAISSGSRCKMNAPWPGLSHGCPVQLFAASYTKLLQTTVQPLAPVAGLGPATHVFEGGMIDGREGVDSRVKPG